MIEWGLDNATGQCHEQPVSTPRDLDTALDGIEQERGRGNAPYVVTIYPLASDDEGLQIGVGHPERGFVLYVREGGGYGHEPEVSQWTEPIEWDYNGQVTEYEPQWTQVRPAAVRKAAREYVATGQRPTCLTWADNSGDDVQ